VHDAHCSAEQFSHLTSPQAVHCTSSHSGHTATHSAQVAASQLQQVTVQFLQSVASQDAQRFWHKMQCTCEQPVHDSVCELLTKSVQVAQFILGAEL